MTDELGTTGKAIWDAFGAGNLDGASQALVRELARCGDTLDRLNDLAAGRRDVWVSLVFDDLGEVTLTVDKVLDEQRKTQVVFKTLYGELRQAGVKPDVKPARKDEGEQGGGTVDVLAEFKKRKADRERQSG